MPPGAICTRENGKQCASYLGPGFPQMSTGHCWFLKLPVYPKSESACYMFADKCIPKQFSETKIRPSSFVWGMVGVRGVDERGEVLITIHVCLRKGRPWMSEDGT